VWGGDGTAHLAINAMMETGCNPEKAVGFLRGGTGNGIQDSYSVPFGLSRQVHTYARSISRNLTVKVDLLRVAEGARVRFGQLLGLGFDARVLRLREEGARGRRRSTGLFGYGLAVLRAFLTGSFSGGPEYRIVLRDGKYAYRGPRINAEYSFRQLERRSGAPMIEVGTRPYYGKLFKVCPDVVCNDGNMDLYIFDIPHKRSVVFNFSALWRGKHDVINRRLIARRLGMIERYEVRRVDVACAEDFHYHVDGELLRATAAPEAVTAPEAATAPAGGSGGDRGGARLSVSVVPEALRFLVPERFYRLFHPFDYDESFQE
jgi:diacylglycerol kinase family enzyme